VLLLSLLVEGIFLSERFISILRMIIDEPIGLANSIPLLLWTAPELYLALPIVVLIATYQVILRRRERLEFVALASGGQSSLALTRSTAAVALLAMAFSLLISGAVYPYAEFAFRIDRSHIRYEALRAGGASGRFLRLPGYAVYIFPSEPTPGKRPVFIQESVDKRTQRIINADRAEFLDEAHMGSTAIRLIGATVHTFEGLDGPRPVTGEERPAGVAMSPCGGCEESVKILRAESLMKELNLNDLVQVGERGIDLGEWTTPELLGWATAPGKQTISDRSTLEAVRRFARGLLCLLAPFLAWVAVLSTTRRSFVFVLPLACAVLMCGDIAFSQMISVFSSYGAVVLAIALMAVTFALMVFALGQILARQHLMVFPALARS